jgi:hypothetical protein
VNDRREKVAPGSRWSGSKKLLATTAAWSARPAPANALRAASPGPGRSTTAGAPGTRSAMRSAVVGPRGWEPVRPVRRRRHLKGALTPIRGPTSRFCLGVRAGPNPRNQGVRCGQTMFRTGVSPRWTVWIPHRGRRGRADRANSKKDLVTARSEVCVPHRVLYPWHAVVEIMTEDVYTTG